MCRDAPRSRTTRARRRRGRDRRRAAHRRRSGRTPPAASPHARGPSSQLHHDGIVPHPPVACGPVGGVILVAGEALIDLVPSSETAEELAAHPGGGPFNAARTIGRLERPVAYL